MIKIPRFVKEYANYQKQSIFNCKLMQSEIKEKAITKIDNALRMAERRLITVDESMRLIMNCFN